MTRRDTGYYGTATGGGQRATARRFYASAAEQGEARALALIDAAVLREARSKLAGEHAQKPQAETAAADPLQRVIGTLRSVDVNEEYARNGEDLIPSMESAWRRSFKAVIGAALWKLNRGQLERMQAEARDRAEVAESEVG